MSIPRRTPAGYAEFDGDKQFATTLARGITLLGCFTPREPLLSNKDLASLTGLPKATVSRLTYTLTQMGLLRWHRRSQRYQIGAAVLALGYPLLGSMLLRQIARPLMNELADHTGGSVALSTRDRLSMVYLETSRSRSSLSDQKSDVGFSLPLIASVTGRAYLVACDVSDRSSLLNEIRLRQPELWSEYEAKLEPAFTHYRSKGFCVAFGDTRKDLWAISAPIRRPRHEDILVLTCAVQSHRIKPRQFGDNLGPRLAALAQALEQVVG